MKILKCLILGFACIATVACSTSQISGVSQTKNTAPEHKKVLVVASFPDIANRSVFEDAFVKQFEDNGISVTASYNGIPEAPTKEAVIQSIKDNGYTMVVVTMLRDIQRRAVYFPSDVATTDYYYNHMFTYFDYTQSEMSRSLDNTLISITLETTVYNAETGDILISISSKTDDPSNVASKSEDLTRKLFKTLKQHNVF